MAVIAIVSEKEVAIALETIVENKEAVAEALPAQAATGGAKN